MNPVKRQTQIGTSYSAIFSRDGSLLATLGRSVWVWDVASHTKLFRAHPFSHPSSADFSPDNSEVTVKSTSGQIAIISAASGKTMVDFRNYEDGEGCNVLYSPCGEYLIDGTWDGRLSVRRAKTGKREFVQDFPDEMIQGIYRSSTSGRWVIAHGPKATTDDQPPPLDYFSIWEWPFRAGKFDLLDKRIPFVMSAALSPDGNSLAVAHGGPPTSLSVLKLVDGSCIGTVVVEYGGTGSELGWSSDGRYIGSIQDETIVFYEFPSLSQVNKVSLEFPSDITFSPRQDLIALGSWQTGWLLPMDVLTAPNILLGQKTRKRSAI